MSETQPTTVLEAMAVCTPAQRALIDDAGAAFRRERITVADLARDVRAIALGMQVICDLAGDVERNRRSLPTGTAAPAEPDPTVFAVVYASYADDEVHALYKTRELATAERDRLGCMWEVSEWTVNSTPDKPEEP